MMIKIQRRGFTIIEVIVVIVVIAVAITPLSILIVNVVERNILSSAQATATSLAGAEMERVTALRYSSVTCEAASAFSAPFANYTYEVEVDYVNPANLNTSVGRPSPCSGAGGAVTDYKRVRVIVDNDTTEELTLTTLVANDW